MNLLFGTHFSSARLLLPLGISFYTFQSMGYLIDVYRGKYAPDRNPFRFALFVSFFPQILQGPIGRYDRLASQLYGQKSFSLTRIERGLQLMLWGYFKKNRHSRQGLRWLSAKYSAITSPMAASW